MFHVNKYISNLLVLIVINIGMNVPLRIDSSRKSEYILKVSYFLYDITCYKLPQYPRGFLPWHLDVCKSSVYMIHLLMFLIIGYFD